MVSLNKIIFHTNYFFSKKKNLFQSKINKVLRVLNYYKIRTIKKNIDSPTSDPVLVTGIYRSGTSIGSRLVQALGVDFGENEHIYSAIGKIKHLNIEGFEENFLFNEIGHFLLMMNGGNGKYFSSVDEYEKFSLEQIKDGEFWYFATEKYGLNEDRISKEIRLGILNHYNISNINQYISDYFDTKFWGFKDVHAGVYLPVYKKKWPRMKVVVLYRQPADFVRSARDLIASITCQTWVDYYKRINEFTKNDENTLWLNYDKLTEKNTDELVKLISFIDPKRIITDQLLDNMKAMIRPKNNKDASGDYKPNDAALSLYKRLSRL